MSIPPFRPDYYELLEAPHDASPEALKRAYYQKAKKYHPDHNDGDAAAEEQFKLVAEAYRVLGDAEERRLYDERLAREIRYAAAPELAGMRRRVRMSARRGRTRAERRGTGRARPFLLRRNRPMPWWVMCLFCLTWVSFLMPLLVRVHRGATPQENVAKRPEPAAKTLSAAEIQARLSLMNDELRRRAEQGDAAAQLRYGFVLYQGVGIERNREEARRWWEKAAAQGNAAAVRCLQSFKPEPPAQEAAASEAPR